MARRKPLTPKQRNKLAHERVEADAAQRKVTASQEVRRDMGRVRAAIREVVRMGIEPDVELELLVPAKIGKLAVRSSFQISEYTAGTRSPSVVGKRLKVADRVPAWLVADNNDVLNSDKPYDKTVIAVTADGRTWGGVFKPHATGGVPVLGVQGEGDYLQRFTADVSDDPDSATAAFKAGRIDTTATELEHRVRNS